MEPNAISVANLASAACSSIRLVLRLGRMSQSDGVKVLLLGLASVLAQPPALRAPTHSNNLLMLFGCIHEEVAVFPCCQ